MSLLLLAIVALPLVWVWPQRGVTARYYDNTEWAGDAIASRIESTLTLSTVEREPETFPQRQFSLLMEGWLRIDRAGEYSFSTRSDDGSTLDVADERIVENGGLHAARTLAGTIYLDPGMYPLRLRYIQVGGPYSLEVLWTEPGAAESLIPLDRLYVHALRVPGLAFVMPRVGLLWGLAWLGALMLVATRMVRSGFRLTPDRIRWLGLRAGVVVGAVACTLALLEVGIRLGRSVLEDGRALEARLVDSQASEPNATRPFNLGGIVQPSAFDGIVYELKPNLRGVFVDQPLAVNADGLRDREYSRRKPGNTIRLVGLGDSSLFGWGVRHEDVSLEVLERRLNEAGSSTHFEVMNFAVPGYNTAIEAEVFIQKASQYDPDVVLLNFNTNDYDVPTFMKLPENYSTLRTSFLFDVVYSRYQAITGVQRREMPVFDFANRTLTLEETARLDEDPALPEEYRYMVGVSGFERAIDKLVAAADELDVPLVVFDVRGFAGLHSTYAPNDFRDQQRERLERFSEEKGFHWLNTYPYYVDYLNAHPSAQFPRVFAVSDTDSHPNALAHVINAQALYDYLVERGIVSVQ